MKKYLVSEGLKPYLRKILDRRLIDHHFENDGEHSYCYIYMSCNSFHRLVKRAACENRSNEDGITYITEEESRNPIKCAALKKELGVNSAVILK